MRIRAIAPLLLLLGSATAQDTLPSPHNRACFFVGMNWYAPMAVEPIPGQPAQVEGRASWGYRFGASYTHLLKGRTALLADGGFFNHPFTFTAWFPKGTGEGTAWKEVSLHWFSGRTWYMGAGASHDKLLGRRLSLRMSASLHFNFVSGLERNEVQSVVRDAQNDSAYFSELEVEVRGSAFSFQLQCGILRRGNRYNEWGVELIADLGLHNAYTGTYTFDAGAGNVYTGDVHLNFSSIGFRVFRTITWGPPKVARWVERARARGVPVGE